MGYILVDLCLCKHRWAPCGVFSGMWITCSGCLGGLLSLGLSLLSVVCEIGIAWVLFIHCNGCIKHCFYKY